MSTRSTILMSEKYGVHIYQELLDMTIHLELERDGIEIDIRIMDGDEWEASGMPLSWRPPNEQGGV